jgi:hypothetical protein
MGGVHVQQVPVLRFNVLRSLVFELPEVPEVPELLQLSEPVARALAMAWPLDDKDDKLTLPQEVLDTPDPGQMFVFDMFPVDPDDPAWRDSANGSGIKVVDAPADIQPGADPAEEALQPTRLRDTAALRRHLGLPPDPNDVVEEPRAIRLVTRRISEEG